MDSGTSNLIDMLSERVMELADAGKWEEAMHSADAAIEQARISNSGDADDINRLAASLEIKGDLLRQLSYLEEARMIYLEALELLDNGEVSAELLGRISASIGVIYDAVSNDEEAIIFYEHAISMYESMDPPRMNAVADICNNLGFIYRSLGNMDTAETLFLKGLQICRNSYGKNHEKTATLFNNLGALYLKAGMDAQAREMNTMALESRIACFGENHPDTAQSYSNLALSLVQTGDNRKARELFEKSLAIYEKHIKTESYEYASVAENYAEFLRETADIKGSNNIIKKAQKKLAKV
jgi:tetratricopeptide (TPR) repeat protein